MALVRGATNGTLEQASITGELDTLGKGGSGQKTSGEDGSQLHNDVLGYFKRRTIYEKETNRKMTL